MDFQSILQQNMAAGNGQQQDPPMVFCGYTFDGAQFTQHQHQRLPPMPVPQSTLISPPPPPTTAHFTMPEVQSNTGEEKVKKTRKRQQTSCSECHRRKQKCNKEVPCDRCIKRGTADYCRILMAGEIATTPPELPRSVPNADLPKPKKRQRDATDDLIARVQQLETMIKLQTQLANGVSVGDLTPARQSSNGSASTQQEDEDEEDDNDDDDANSQQSLVAVAAADALGQLSSAMSKEGGSEARIYSGPGSLADFINASGLAADNGVDLDPGPRVRMADMHTSSSLPTLLNTPHPESLTKLADALQEQKAKLPPAHICHYLFDLYYGNMMFTERTRFMPRGSIQFCYDALFDPKDMDRSPNAQAARALNYPQIASPVSLAFLSLIFVKLACALIMSPETTRDTHILSCNMYEASRSAFMASERREQPTYAHINALLTQTVWLKFTACPSLGFTYVSQAIRFGQSMGLHREPGEKWGLDAFECEIRRRTWWALFCADRGHSLAYGRPYTIIDAHCDVRLPANINDVDLTANGPTNIRPMSEVTQLTGHFAFIEICKVAAKVIDRAYSCMPPTYATIIELDKLITKMENETIPAAFKNPSVQDLTEKPYIKPDLEITEIIICYLRATLHRPYLLKHLPKPGEPDHFAGSRAIAIALSQRQLVLAKDFLARLPDFYLAFFGFAHQTFEPAVNLAMAIHQDPYNPNTYIIDSHVQLAMALLERMSPYNKCAQEGVANLKYMREKYLSKMGDTPYMSNSTSSTSATSPQVGNSVSSSSKPSPSSASTSTHTSFRDAQPSVPDNAATPNTLFNQFFRDYASPAGDIDYSKLIASSDPQAAWMTETAGVEDWPSSYRRLENEEDLNDWKKMLGL